MSDEVISSSSSISSHENEKSSKKHKLSDNSSDKNVKRQKVGDQKKKEDAELSQRDMKKIKLLENAIQECKQKITQLEEEEIEWSDDDSAYIKVDRYKRKLLELCKCLSKMNRDTSMKRQIFKKKITRKDIPDEMTGDLSIDEAILDRMNSDLKKINKMKYLETQGYAQFVKTPEYLDILQCIQECNTTNDLNFSQEKVNNLAKKAFLAIGHYLKKKRIEDTEVFMQFLLDESQIEDPARKDPELDKKLQEHRIQADKKLEGVFKEFIKREDDLKNEEIEKRGEGASKDDLDSHTRDGDNTVGEPALESSNSENSLVSKNPPNFIETSQVFVNVNDDAAVTNNDNDLDDIVAVEDSPDLGKLSGSKVLDKQTEADEIEILSGSELPTIKTETNDIIQLDMESSSHKSTSINKIRPLMEAPSRYTITRNIADVAKSLAKYNKSQRQKLEPIVIDLT